MTENPILGDALLPVRALEVALYAHAGQKDKLGDPYLHHVLRVGIVAAADGPVHAAVGLLHDVVEDTPITLHNLLHNHHFPLRVVNSVERLSKPPGITLVQYWAVVREDPVARRVKLIDIADNMREDRMCRLAEQDPATARRLRAKYTAARRALS
jgi:(p)ppGpp synthase/HD superfamily hydrolase